MFARSTTINGDSGSIDAGVAYVRDQVMPMLSEMPGFVGLSMMVDRESGRSIATTSWTSYDEMAASAANVSDARARAAEIMGGTPVVDEWEIAMMHREHDAREGSCCRVTWVQMDPEAIDSLIARFRRTVMPSFDEMAGFCSASLLVDRANGRGCSTARFDDQKSMMDAAPAARGLREDGVREVGFHVMDVEEFELAIAHLRVPELV
jgi:heme-degrading monooxygenase HmoA